MGWLFIYNKDSIVHLTCKVSYKTIHNYQNVISICCVTKWKFAEQEICRVDEFILHLVNEQVRTDKKSWYEYLDNSWENLKIWTH